MKQAMSLILALILCLSLCACGNQEKYKKYDTLIGYIEAGDAENATKEFWALLEQNKPETTEPEITEPATTTVEITMDNWQEYFELVLSGGVDRNAFNEIEYAYCRWKIALKKEYHERAQSADVAFGWLGGEYGKCMISYDLNTGLITYSDYTEKDPGYVTEERTCSFTYSNKYVTEGSNDFAVDLVNSYSLIQPLEINDDVVIWKDTIFTSTEITRVQGSITLTAE